MTWIKANNLARANARMWIAALVVLVSAMTTTQRSAAQAMQKGISVQLVPTSSAVPVPNADGQDALIITVTESGKLYVGLDPVTPASLAEKLKSGLAGRTQNLYIKADARSPYASVVKVVDAAHATGIASVTLLTTQQSATQAGTVVSPEGIEMKLAQHPSAETK
jgi:biopolymer transport protein ExbD